MEDLVADDGQDAPVNPVADEGVALARAGLSVGEHGAVIPSHRVLKHGSAEVVVDLGRVRARARVGIRVGVGVGVRVRVRVKVRVGVRVKVRPLSST